MTTPNIQNAKVELTALEGTTPKLVATVYLENGVVRIEGEETWKKRLEAGVGDTLLDVMFTPADGYAFLAALPRAYRTPYLFAVLKSQG